MSKFKVGDRVIQIEPSQATMHNFPNEVLLVSRVGGVGGVVYFAGKHVGGSTAGRFKLYKEPVVDTKDTNPKDACGIKKIPTSTISALVKAEVGVAMLEGAMKYGRHNYRITGVRASVYYDAVNRHMDAFWEGEDIDPDSGLPHISKAIAGLVVLRDAQLQDKFVDDRPPKSKDGWQADLQPTIDELFKKYPDPKPAHTEVGNDS